MLGVDLKKDLTEFVPSRNEPAVETVLMIPRPWTNAQEFRPVRGNLVDDKGASNKESGNVSSNMEENMSLTEKEKRNLTKTDPLSIKNPKKDTFKKFSTKKGKILCGKDCLFRGKECSFDVENPVNPLLNHNK